MRRGKPKSQIIIAKERIEILINEAKKNSIKYPDYSTKYVKLAKKIGMRYNVKLGILKRKFCKKCFSYYTTDNSTRRFDNKTLVITCKKCKNISRFPYSKQK